jgi:hypothetical protein
MAKSNTNAKRQARKTTTNQPTQQITKQQKTAPGLVKPESSAKKNQKLDASLFLTDDSEERKTIAKQQKPAAVPVKHENEALMLKQKLKKLNACLGVKDSAGV